MKAGLTVVALGLTAYARALGAKLEDAGPIVVNGPTDPAPETPEDVAKLQRQLKLTQWAIPAATGALLVIGARMGERQRPHQVLEGIAKQTLSAVGNGLSAYSSPLLHRS